ncbi:MAG: chromosomal replication initiator protein DnaA [Deltaproteobacteria bacterium]|nr:chromosomal replication initiator protein DnaA [Deltaproteobacteria bacterium]
MGESLAEFTWGSAGNPAELRGNRAEMDNRGGWEAVRADLRRRVGEAVFEAWFRALDGRLEGETLVLRCPDRFSRDWLRSRYGKLIEECAGGVRAVDYRVEPVRTAAAPATARPIAQPASEPESDERGEISGAQERLFESFIEGPSNALALEAARLVARGQAGRCSPLFLYAKTGMGKSHLCRAIHGRLGHAVTYRSSEEFTTEVTDAMRAGQMPRIRQRYRRSTNVLILEDVQFLAGKRATQVELFHTLDHLMSHGKTIVLSADRPPAELAELDPKLSSRMASGLVACIAPPEQETRLAILRERAARGGVRVPDACLELLARRELASVRDLVGGLNQVVARASLLKTAITPELVGQALAAVELPGRARSLDEIMAETARAYGVGKDDLRARSRKQSLTRPRQIAMYLARIYTEASLAEIGRAFNRDHTSVMYAIGVVERRIVEKPQLRYELEALAQRVNGGQPRRSASGSSRGTRPT